jgi:hypothetical protein
MVLGPSLAPLGPLKGQFSYIKGLFNKAATGVGIHPGMTGNLLSGAPLTRGAELHGGVSLDQVLASRIGDQTVQPSMVLGCEQPVTGYHETNFSMASAGTSRGRARRRRCRWRVSVAGVDSLFENRGSQRNRAWLDRVMAQVAHEPPRQSDREADEYPHQSATSKKRAGHAGGEGEGRGERGGRRVGPRWRVDNA